MSPLVSIIIVNYNSTSVLKKCLSSIVESAFTFPHEIIIVDNASSEAVDAAVREHPAVTFVQNTQNFGFAYANNRGIELSSGKYILLLNPDTVVNARSFGPMIAYLEEHPSVAVVGCKIVNADGEVEHSTHSFPTLLKEFFHANELLKVFFRYDSAIAGIAKKIARTKSLESYWEHDSVREVDHVTGACMLVRKEAVDAVGLLDEAFFLYNEEVEWSYRMKQSGYTSVFLPDSTIIHLFGHSTRQRVQKQIPNRLLVERYRGMFYFFQKHHSWRHVLALRCIVLEGFTLRMIATALRALAIRSRRRELLQEIRYIIDIVQLVFKRNFDWREVQ